MELHNLLQRQMKRLGLTEDKIPTHEQWMSFLERLSRTYTETDQERYLLERSMEISSHEANELTEKLEHAQQIAHLGYWQYDKATGVITFSNEMYHMFDLKPEEPIPSCNELMNYIVLEDRNILSAFIERAFEKGEDYQIETKIKTSQGSERWCYFAASPDKKTTPITILSGIGLDITARKIAEKKLHELNQQFVASARRAGMSEVATSVLHNVGNILNSVTTSSSLLQKIFKEIDINSIFAIIKMMNDHQDDLKNYLTNDSKGKLIPQLLKEIKIHIQNQFDNIEHEITRLNANIAHIKNIVDMQNTLSGAPGIKEQIPLENLILSVIDIDNETLKKRNIQLTQKIEKDFLILTDKNKVAQILVNLIQNAKDSVLSTVEKNKCINVTTIINKNSVDINVTDNGMGIDKDNIIKIFSFGFTTKQKGHGFGLHSSALLAKELGGKLQAKSDGVGKGATFTLTLPLEEEIERSVTHV